MWTSQAWFRYNLVFFWFGLLNKRLDRLNVLKTDLVCLLYKCFVWLFLEIEPLQQGSQDKYVCHNMIYGIQNKKKTVLLHIPGRLQV